MTTPTVADLEAATAATAAAIESGDLADVYLAAEAEEGLYAQIFTGPCDRAKPDAADPQPELEIEL